MNIPRKDPEFRAPGLPAQQITRASGNPGGHRSPLRVCLVTSGRCAVPPSSWYSLEEAVWNFREALQDLGVDVYLVNTMSAIEVLNDIREIRPHVVHIFDESYFPMNRGIRSSVCILQSEAPKTYRKDRVDYALRLLSGEAYIACSSEYILNYLAGIGINEKRLIFNPLGVDGSLVRFTAQPTMTERAICAGVISDEKRQHLLRNIEFVDLAGPIRPKTGRDSECLPLSRIVAEWSLRDAYRSLTDYGAYVNLSSAEASPTITCVAMMAGLGLVLSEDASRNIESPMPFVRVLTDGEIRCERTIRAAIREVQEISRPNRMTIRTHAVRNYGSSRLALEYKKVVEMLSERCDAAFL